MTYKRHQIAIDYVNILMQFLIAYLTMTVILYPFDDQSPLHILVLLPAPYLSYFIRKYTRHIWSFAVLHLILAAGYLLTTDNTYYIMMNGIYLLALASISYYSKQRLQDRTNTSLFLIMFFIFIYASCYQLDFKELLPLSFWLAISYALLYILNMYLLNLDRFVRNHEHLVNVPFRQIKNSNHILTAFLCCLFFLTMLSFSRLPFGTVLAFFGSLLIKALRFLITWLSRQKPEETEWIEEEPEPSQQEMPITEPSRFMEILSVILQWMIAIALIIGAVALILYTIYRIYQHFYRKGEEAIKDEVEFLSPFEKKEKLKQKRVKLGFHLLGKSNNTAIRKHFAKAVLANAGAEPKLSESLTPYELSEYAIQSRDENPSSEEEDRKLITGCYEKARYSNEVCTREEVRLVKKMLKGKSITKESPVKP